MKEVPAGLEQLAEDAVALLGATAVAVRVLDGEGGLDTVALAGRNAAALVAVPDEPAGPVRGRWRRREQAGPGEPESHPITGSDGQPLGLLVVDRGTAAPAGRAGEAGLRLVLDHAAALLQAHALAARLDSQEELLAERLDQLRISDQALRVAFEEAVVGMAMISLDRADAGRYLRVNDALCRLTGYSREELLARPFEELTHPEDRGLTASAMRRAMAGRRTPFRTEKRFLHADGSIFWVRVTASPLFDDDDRPLFALGQVEDLSQRGDHDAEMAAQLDPLTGMLNADALEEGLIETVQRANRIGTGCAVLLAELAGWDEFLAGEDPSGSLADDLQVALAQRLRTTLRNSDVISRMGQNQFVIITEEVGPEQVQAVARRLEEALATPETIDGRQFSMSTSLGLSVLSGEPGDDAGQSAKLLADARTALAQARTAGGGTHVLYRTDEAEPRRSTSRTLYVHPDWQARSPR